MNRNILILFLIIFLQQIKFNNVELVHYVLNFKECKNVLNEKSIKENFFFFFKLCT